MRRRGRRGRRISDRVKAEAAVLVAEGMPKAEAARELGIARESLRRISQDPLWQHWFTLARERLTRGAKFQATVHELLGTRTCPEEEERRVPYSETRNVVVDAILKANGRSTTKGSQPYTEIAKSIDTQIEHHLGHRIEENELAATFALFDLVAGTLGDEVDDKDDPSTETWTAKPRQHQPKKGVQQ